MAKVTVLILAVIICQLCFGDDCTFFGNRTIFLKRSGDFTYILPSEGPVQVYENRRIIAYCPENFFKENENEFFLKCEGRNRAKNFMCPQSSKLYKHEVVGCHHGSYISQVIIKGVPIVFAEICFHLSKFRTEFLHYVIAERAPILEYQNQYNPNPANLTTNAAVFESRIFEVLLLNRYNGQKNVQSALYTQLNYEQGSLLPTRLFAPYFSEPKLGVLDNVVWWKPLKDGNWEFYEFILRKRAKETPLDIYAGTSHDVDVSLCDCCNYEEYLRFKKSHRETEAPLYIWNYVRERTNEGNLTEFVVIGVNSPFLSLADLEQMKICEDICDTIGWLDTLKRLRKMPGLGFIYCCDPSQVRNKLRGFPQLAAPIKQSIGTFDFIPLQWNASMAKPDTKTDSSEDYVASTDHYTSTSTEYGDYYSPDNPWESWDSYHRRSHDYRWMNK